jgi:hypothetical protein
LSVWVRWWLLIGLAGFGGSVGAATCGAGAADGSVVVECVAQPLMATAAAKMTAVMIRTGRMATSPAQHDPR